MLKFKEMYVVIPNIFEKKEFLKLYKERGSSEEFIKNLDENWDKFISSTKNNVFKLTTDDVNLNLIQLNSRINSIYDVIKCFPTREV